MGFFRLLFVIFTSFLSVSLTLKSKEPIKAICWDLSYTLCAPSVSSLLKAAGTASYGLYTTWDGKNKDDLRRCINGIFALSGPQQTTYKITDTYSEAYAQSMAHLFLGTDSAHNLLKQALDDAKKLKKAHYFYNDREYYLSTNILNHMLDPYKFAESIEPYAEMVGILEEFAEHYDYYICALWDKESFEFLLTNKAMKKIFRLFPKNNHFISGNVGKAPCDPAFYKAFLKKYHLKAEECLIIDDQQEHIKAAQECGMQTIHYKNDIKAFRKQIKEVLS